MTDFFKTMSEIALGVARTVQPVVVSRFAPGPHLPAAEIVPIREESAESFAGYPTDTVAPSEALEPIKTEQARNETIQSIPHQQPDRHDPIVSTAQPPSLHALVHPQAEADSGRVESLGRSDLPVGLQQPAVTRTDALRAAPAEQETIHSTAPQGRQREIENKPAGVPPLERISSQIEARPSAQAARNQDFVVSDPLPPAAALPLSRGRIITTTTTTTLRQPSILLPEFPERDAASSGERAHREGETVPHEELPAIAARNRSIQPEARIALTKTPTPKQAPIESGYDSAEISDAPPPPIVRVTIGRIEVRAIMPPAPAAPTPSQPSPKLSLDDYLRQHNGRRR